MLAGTYHVDAGVYSGSALVSRDDASFESYFVSVDHSPVRDDKSELAVISISGPGMNLGNVQVVWCLQKIWFAFPGLWPLWTLSFGIVFPAKPVHYQGTM
jgi:hypothetical protein